MDTKVNYTIVGAFIILLTAVVVLAGFWLSNTDHKNYKTYLVYMNESVSGLSEQAPVKFNGVNVGYVQNISLNPNNPQEVRLVLKIEDGTPITESTTATLMSQGVTGIAYIGLKARTPNAPVLKAKAGEPYPVITSSPSLLVELDTALREATRNIKSVAIVFNHVFDQQNQKAIKKTIANIEQFTDVLASNSKKIDESINDAHKILHNTAIATNHLPQTMRQFNTALTSVNSAALKVAHTASQAQLALSASQVAMEEVTQQTLPNIFQSVEHLANVLMNLEQLTNQLQANPSILIRGQYPAKLGPGEK